ncbi:GGDEF domain-containing protein [Sulfuriferula thiophila]|uniref:GGDEF domain-containing protein n=1 Tax=Sulfuriferula thiophila TaxID=1781211 RepID=UPI000F60EC8A|nr:GGDEF domain-containing protein [Sulfuriferula thiophila]
MGLDIRTIMVMIAMLALLLAGLLELARLNAGNDRGIRQWVYANLCIGLGLGLAFFFHTPTPGYGWAVVAGSTLISAAIGLQYHGLQEFKGVRSDWRIAALIVSAVFALNFWLAVLQPDVTIRSIANSLIYAVGYAACARLLLVRTEPSMKSACWFTGLSFALLALVLFVRGLFIWHSHAGIYQGVYTQLPVNTLLFFIATVVQLFVTFGFVLMLNNRLVAEVQKLALRDMLTGAFNRRDLEAEAAVQWARHLRTGDTLAIMMLDIDLFKSVNDQYGHQTGDEVLRHLARIAQSVIRGDDYFARYGGEEFCILMPSTTEQEALVLAERLRTTYAAATIEFSGKPMNSTISVGIADSMQTDSSFSSLIAAADQALYRAKQEGRNRVIAYANMTTTSEANLMHLKIV